MAKITCQLNKIATINNVIILLLVLGCLYLFYIYVINDNTKMIEELKNKHKSTHSTAPTTHNLIDYAQPDPGVSFPAIATPPPAPTPKLSGPVYPTCVQTDTDINIICGDTKIRKYTSVRPGNSPSDLTYNKTQLGNCNYGARKGQRGTCPTPAPAPSTPAGTCKPKSGSLQGKTMQDTCASYNTEMNCLASGNCAWDSPDDANPVMPKPMPKPMPKSIMPKLDGHCEVDPNAVKLTYPTNAAAVLPTWTNACKNVKNNILCNSKQPDAKAPLCKWIPDESMPTKSMGTCEVNQVNVQHTYLTSASKYLPIWANACKTVKNDILCNSKQPMAKGPLCKWIPDESMPDESMPDESMPANSSGMCIASARALELFIW